MNLIDAYVSCHAVIFCTIPWYFVWCTTNPWSLFCKQTFYFSTFDPPTHRWWLVVTLSLLHSLVRHVFTCTHIVHINDRFIIYCWDIIVAIIYIYIRHKDFFKLKLAKKMTKSEMSQNPGKHHPRTPDHFSVITRSSILLANVWPLTPIMSCGNIAIDTQRHGLDTSIKYITFVSHALQSSMTFG